MDLVLGDRAALGLGGKEVGLPSVRELHAVIDSPKASPAIDPMAFPDTPGAWLWSMNARVGSVLYWASSSASRMRVRRRPGPQQAGVHRPRRPLARG